MILQNFEVNDLYGNQSLKMEISDNILLLVAENGSGKTTLLRLLYLFLSKQWFKLIEYEFSTINAVLDDVKYTFRKNEFQNIGLDSEKIKALILKYPLYEKFIKEELKRYDINQLLKDTYLLNDIESEFDIPLSLLFRIVQDLKELSFDETKYNWDVNIIYLPTYRRIERDFHSLFGDLNKRLEQHILNLVPEINLRIESEKSENDNEESETEADLQKVFSELWKTRDIEKWKRKKNESSQLELIEFGMNDVKYKLSELLKKNELNQIAENNLLVDQFLVNCNKYLSNQKEMRLSKNSNFLEIQRINLEDCLDLDTLSSGEKQIVSLFSYLLLDKNKVFVIFDEPEISLSISWQEMLLNDILTCNCEGLVVATHSPFVISDSLKKYTHGLNEFIVK
ncbi:AAA family ATPase [Mucilaginibacter xinganensis]|uniref:Putative ATP-binding protein involved in virulence n=1 Tax=Mucilaginibacter xinganensis TaxID=1234841 RepID=A0A223NQP2_9SPHI|nr:AAA family ATPase [Mucilaginibacter xinganensis]ASU32116.1 putative ATP-binding protein involved in virulence [Mucilaginibacter xinganensis]